MKYVIVCLDGMADQPEAKINGKTAVQAAKTPAIDRLVKQGIVGSMQNTPEGLPPGSDVCNLSLLGYDSSGFYSGRAPYEAASMGIEMEDSDVVFRCNLVTLGNETMIDFSSGHISSAEGAELIQALNEDLAQLGLSFHAGIGYRHILKIDTERFGSFQGLECTPPHDIMGQAIAKYLPQGPNEKLILDLMQRSRKVLAEQPVNHSRIKQGLEPATSIWLWSYGVKPRLESFQNKYGLKGGMISAVDLLNGIAKLAGLEVISVPGATGYYDTDYAAKGRYAIDFLKENDFIFVHVEATDEAGHNGDLEEKIKAIENIDMHVIGPIIDALEGQDYRILIAPDHPTPVSLRTHTSEPVPFLMAGKGLTANGKLEYSEAILKDASAPHYTKGWDLVTEFFLQK